MELRFHRELYTQDGIQSAVAAFADFLDLELQSDSQDVFIVKLQGEVPEQTFLEFQNYALGASIEGM